MMAVADLLDSTKAAGRPPLPRPEEPGMRRLILLLLLLAAERNGLASLAA